MHHVLTRWRLLTQSVSEGGQLNITLWSAHRGPTCGFLVHWLQIAIGPSVLFHWIFVITWFSPRCYCIICFTVKDPTRIEYIFVIWNCIRIKDDVSGEQNFFKLLFTPSPSIFAAVPRQFICCKHLYAGCCIVYIVSGHCCPPFFILPEIKRNL